jgi:hypothetical protein
VLGYGSRFGGKDRVRDSGNDLIQNNAQNRPKMVSKIQSKRMTVKKIITVVREQRAVGRGKRSRRHLLGVVRRLQDVEQPKISMSKAFKNR